MTAAVALGVCSVLHNDDPANHPSPCRSAEAEAAILPQPGARRPHSVPFATGMLSIAQDLVHLLA